MTLRWSLLICPTGVQMPVLAQNLRTEAPARFDTPTLVTTLPPANTRFVSAMLDRDVPADPMR